MDMTAWENIAGANTDSYTPVEADAGYYLRATASYADNQGSGKSATSEASEQVSLITSPMFDEGLDTEISVAENTAAGAIGNPFTATDADGDTPVYSLASGTGASFSINAATGQLSTTRELDYETATSYTIMVQARDNEDASGDAATAVDDTHAVTVNVTNVDELGTVTLAPTRPSVGTPITATLADEDSGVANTAWQWASAGRHGRDLHQHRRRNLGQLYPRRGRRGHVPDGHGNLQGRARQWPDGLQRSRHDQR